MQLTSFTCFVSLIFVFLGATSPANAQTVPENAQVFTSNHGMVFSKMENGDLQIKECTLTEPISCKEFYTFTSEEVQRTLKRHKDYVFFNSLERTVFTVLAVGGGAVATIGAGSAALGYAVFYGGSAGSVIGTELVVGAVLVKVGQTLIVSGAVVGGLSYLAREFRTVKIADDINAFFAQLETLKPQESIYLSIEEYSRLLAYEPTNNTDFEYLISPLK
jgi:hypothetical protein